MIVVSGATGNVGRPLVAELAKAGAEVTALSRSAGVDLGDPGSLRPALSGADAFFLLVPGAGADLDPAALTGVARECGVRRIVLLSSQAAPVRPSHAPLRALEIAVAESGLAWTHLRPGGFATNALAWAPSVRTSRTVAAPFGDVGLPVIDPADIAAVAAEVLLGGAEHEGRVYTLTGPEAVTPRSRAAALAEALGEEVRFVEQTPAEARSQMLRFMPEPVVEGTLAILGSPTAAERLPHDDVPRILGRKAGTFAAWARQHVTAFR